MLRFGILTLVVLAAFAFEPASSRAALDMSQPATTHAGVEIVVVEVPGCVYCHLFRRDIWSAYQSSELAKTVPMRFVDLNSEAAESLRLTGPIESVPTALVMRENMEVGRIPNFVGTASFYYAVERLLDGAP